MSKVEKSAAIPEAGRKIPESEQLSTSVAEESLPQSVEDKEVMSVEIALVHALQYLGAKSENPQP